jgi:CRISPR/Cas system-associated exonuclease Cas4 (RecB family)
MQASSAAGAGNGVAILSRPQPAGQVDATAPVTDISVFAQCPRKYYLSRYLRLPSTAHGSGGTSAVQIGTDVHALLAGCHTGAADPEAEALANRFRTSDVGRESAAARNKHHEYDFVFALEDIVLRGQIDLWYERGGEIVLVDYKTDRTIGDLYPYQLQLQLYAHALERATGRMPARGCLYFLRANHIVEVDLSPLALNAARESVRRFRFAQQGLRFDMEPGEHCYRCEYASGACPVNFGSHPVEITR